MKNLFLLLFAFAAIGVSAQVTNASTTTGSNSGDGEISTAITALNTADNLLEDRSDSAAATIIEHTTELVLFDTVYAALTGTIFTTDSIEFDNGANISNISADSLIITEVGVAIHGALQVSGDITTDGSFPADFAITDYQPPLLDYWAETQELNRLPSFKGKSRNNVMTYINGLEEAVERQLRYIVEMEHRIQKLEGK